MKQNHAYTVHYRMSFADTVRFVCVLASSKQEAYDKAVYEAIPKEYAGFYPYSAWVSSVTYNNGNERKFNTFEGLPY